MEPVLVDPHATSRAEALLASMVAPSAALEEALRNSRRPIGSADIDRSPLVKSSTATGEPKRLVRRRSLDRAMAASSPAGAVRDLQPVVGAEQGVERPCASASRWRFSFSPSLANGMRRA